MFFVCDVGGTNLRVAVVDEEGVMHSKFRYPTPKDYEQFLQLINKQFSERSKEFEISKCCFSVAGAVFGDNQVWLPNVFGSKRYNLISDLRKSLVDVEVFAIDDRAAGLLGELWKGCAVGKRDVLYLIVGTGVGLGILANGVLISGHQGLAGSVGWIQFDDHLTGKSENIEKLISCPAILERFRAVCETQLDRTEEVFELYKQGHSGAEVVVKQTATYLGDLLAIVANIFNPQMIVLAGSLALQWGLLQATTNNVLRERLSPAMEQPIVEASFLGEDAQLFGCAKHILKSTERSE